MAGFEPYRRTNATNVGETRDFIITDSTTITIGDAVALNAGYIDLASDDGVGAGTAVLGVVVGFVKKTGTAINDPVLPIQADASGSNSATETGNPGNPGSETVATASDNITVDQIMARVIIDLSQEYYNDADDSLTAAHIGTYFDAVGASDQISVSSTGSTGQFVLLQRDPHNDSDASKGIFRIAEHALSL